MDRIVADGGLREWAPRAFSEFARTHALHAIGTRGLPWTEIDFPEDYRHALVDVLPEIEADPAPHAFRETSGARLLVASDSR
jgi:hypothetical protein